MPRVRSEAPARDFGNTLEIGRPGKLGAAEGELEGGFKQGYD